MRWAKISLCCLFLAFTFAGGGATLFASDLKSPRQSSPQDRDAEDALTEERVAEFCYSQRKICRKICYLRFRDDQIGCPQSCESRVARCIGTGCYKWVEAEFLIAEKFGGYRCPL
jgi:hypothetical protein